VQNSTRKSLGPLIATYRYRPLGWRETLLYLGLGLLAIGIPLAYGFTRYRDGFNNHGELAAITWSRPWFLLAGFALICCSLLFVHRLRLAGRYIAIHQRGLYIDVQKVYKIRWEEISGISTAMFQPSFLGIRHAVRFRASIIPNLGKPILIQAAYENLPECITRLKARLYPRLIAELKQTFLEEKWVFFGPVAIQRDTLRLHNKQIPWSEVKRVSVAKGSVVVELVDHSTKRIPAEQIPNVEILLQLIDQGVPS
jgi:Family of unknown function (DUF6585)